MGTIYDDYNSEMASLPTRMARFEEMYRSDGASAAMEALVSLPLLATSWDITDGSDVKLSARLRSNIFGEDMNTSWLDMLGAALQSVLFGFAVHEKVFELFEDGFLGYGKFAERSRPTVYRWEFNGTGSVRGMEQWGLNPASGNTLHVQIPIEKLMIWTWRRRLNNPEGMGVFRQAYKHHFYKTVWEEIGAIKIERNAVGVPTITPPEDYSQGLLGADYQDVLGIASRVRSGEATAMAFPKPGWKAEWSFGGDSSVPFQEMIELEDRYMLRSMLGQFLAGTAGAAASVDATSLLLLAMRGVADWVCEYFSRYAIRPLVMMNDPAAVNWRKGYKFPRLQHGMVGKRDPEKLAGIIALMTNPRFSLMPDEWRDAVSDELDLPRAPEGHWERMQAMANVGLLPPDSAVPPQGDGITQGDGGGPGMAREQFTDTSATPTETGGAPLK
jgi:hypothetical protein